MKKNIVIDTNLLLDDPKIIYKLSKKYEKIVIPLTVLKELDKHKFNRDLSYSARTAIYEIVHFKEQFPDKIKLSINDNELSTNDLLIIDAAIESNASLATKDISMSVIAEAKKVETKLYSVISNGIDDPYIYIDLDSLENSDFTYANEYDLNPKDSLAFGDVEITTERWQFIFLTYKDKIKYVYATNPITARIERVDNNPEYRNISVNGNKIKALDEYQMCAFYAMKKADNILITGKWGTGKTLLSTAYSLSSGNTKTFITRPPVGINPKYDIGFLPGDKDSKLAGWFAGFMSALYYIYANTRNQNNGKKDGAYVSYDIVKDTYFKEKFETLPINAIQGMSLLEGDMMIVDELQLIDIDYVSMLLSRANKGSKLILLGDLAQTYSAVRPSESGLLKLLRILPHKAIAYVDLKNSYRNDLIELADMLQDKTIG